MADARRQVRLDAGTTALANLPADDPLFSPARRRAASAPTASCSSGPSWRGTTEVVSVDAAGTGRSDHATARGHSFSPDGTKIVVTSAASNLGPTDTNLNAEITLVTTRADGSDSADGSSYFGRFGEDGCTVIFRSTAEDR